MSKRLVATGLTANPSCLWVYFRDTQLVAPRPRAVQVPWAMVADRFCDLSEGAETVFLERLKAQNERAQLPLPLEAWE